MGESLAVHIVQAVHRLVEVSASDLLRKLASLCHEVK